MTFGLPADTLRQIRSALQQFPQIEQAVIFGSRAMGNYQQGSDVDLALMGNIDTHTVLEVSALLNERLPLPYHFDVVNYHRTHTDLQKHIDQEGKILYINPLYS